MSSIIDQMIKEIGQRAFQSADDRSDRIMIYCEMEWGAISADLFYIGLANKLRYRECPDDLLEFIYKFWKAWRAETGHREWRTMTMVIDQDHLKIDMQYPEELDPADSIVERRPLAVANVFGNMAVDYSSRN